jgi:hypothetical protein
MRIIALAKEANLSIPRDLSLLSGSGVLWPETPFSYLTRTHQPLEEIGASLLAMTVDSHRAGRSLPATYMLTPFVGGGTTTLLENALFGIPNDRESPDSSRQNSSSLIVKNPGASSEAFKNMISPNDAKPKQASGYQTQWE